MNRSLASASVLGDEPDSQTLVALKDNPLALVALLALCALGVTAYAIRAVIVSLQKRGGNP